MSERESVEALADWFGGQVEAYNVTDITDEQTTLIDVVVDSLAERILASDWLAARDAEQRARGGAAEREAWASWLEGWLGAVGPEPPTPEAILRWLRAEQRPFGKSAALDAQAEAGRSDG